MPLGRGRLSHCFSVEFCFSFFFLALQPQLSLSLHLSSSLYLLSADSIREPHASSECSFMVSFFALPNYCYEQAWLDRDHSAQATWTDPPLPLVEFAAQLLPVSLTHLMFEFLAVKGPSPKARTEPM